MSTTCPNCWPISSSVAILIWWLSPFTGSWPYSELPQPNTLPLSNNKFVIQSEIVWLILYFSRSIFRVSAFWQLLTHRLKPERNPLRRQLWLYVGQPNPLWPESVDFRFYNVRDLSDHQHPTQTCRPDLSQSREYWRIKIIPIIPLALEASIAKVNFLSTLN